MFNKIEYDKKYMQDNIKTIKVYVRKENYEGIKRKVAEKYPQMKMSEYIRILIENDLK